MKTTYVLIAVLVAGAAASWWPQELVRKFTDDPTPPLLPAVWSARLDFDPADGNATPEFYACDYDAGLYMLNYTTKADVHNVYEEPSNTNYYMRLHDNGWHCTVTEDSFIILITQDYLSAGKYIGTDNTGYHWLLQDPDNPDDDGMDVWTDIDTGYLVKAFSDGMTLTFTEFTEGPPDGSFWIGDVCA